MSELKDRLIFSQFSHKGNGPDPLHTHAISTVAAGFGDGQRRDFGIFILTQAYSQDPNNAVKGVALVSRAVATEIIQKFYYPILSQETNLPPLKDTLTQAVNETDRYVKAKLTETGIALTAAIIISEQLYLIHIGNNRAYLSSGTTFEQLTQDLNPSTDLSDDEAQQLIGYGKAHIAFSTHPLPTNAKVLLCNPGVWQVLEPDEIGAVLTRYDTPESACTALDALFEERDNGNVTAIFIQKPYAN